MITITIMLLTHWLGDFVMQTDEEAKNKSKSFKYLFDHTSTYSFLWFLVIFVGHCVSMLYYDGRMDIKVALVGAAIFSLITFVCHTITDFFTSRWVKKYWEKSDYHTMFVIIGIDQVLHYVQLFWTYKYLFI